MQVTTRSRFLVALALFPLAAAAACAPNRKVTKADDSGLELGTATAIPSSIPFESLEGPYWVAAGGYLIFSDVVEQNGEAAKIYRYDPKHATFSVVPYPGAPVSTNGLAMDKDGNLLACERWNGALVRVAGGHRSVLADRAPGDKPLNAPNAPNDLTVRTDGTIYFSDTTWGARPGDHAKTAIYRVSPFGAVSVAYQVDMPNGVVLSPDGNTLYVGSDAQNRLWRMAVAGDGSLGPAEPFGMQAGDPRAVLDVPDGLCVDDLGRLYVANNSAKVSAVLVFTPEGGYAGRIALPAPPSNCTFGGEDRRTLYVTTLHAIYAARVKTPGLP
jgi:gluconolactonase